MIAPPTPEEILNQMGLACPEGVYILGCFENRITFFSQQVRALNLVYSLRECGKFQKRRIAVVGAGAGGMTVAAAAARLRQRVLLLESAMELIPLIRGCNTRWLHPHIYDWPLPGAAVPHAGLPLLTWSAAPAIDVVGTITQAWSTLPELELIEIQRGVSDVKIRNNEPTLAWLHENAEHTEEFDVVILALGFGLERSIDRIPVSSYWKDDHLHQVNESVRRVLISGSGDGGITDLLRLKLTDFRHERIYQEVLAGLPDSVSADLLRIDHVASQMGSKESSDYLESEYKELVVGEEFTTRIQHRIRQDTCVTVNSLTSLYTLKACRLNRFLMLILQRLGAFEYKVGKIDHTAIGDEFEVTFSDRERRMFDDLIFRRGPIPALKLSFPELYELAKPASDIQRQDKTKIAIYGSTYALNPAAEIAKYPELLKLGLETTQQAQKIADDWLSSLTLAEGLFEANVYDLEPYLEILSAFAPYDSLVHSFQSPLVNRREKRIELIKSTNYQYEQGRLDQADFCIERVKLLDKEIVFLEGLISCFDAPSQRNHELYSRLHDARENAQKTRVEAFFANGGSPTSPATSGEAQSS